MVLLLWECTYSNTSTLNVQAGADTQPRDTHIVGVPKGEEHVFASDHHTRPYQHKMLSTWRNESCKMSSCSHGGASTNPARRQGVVCHCSLCTNSSRVILASVTRALLRSLSLAIRLIGVAVV